MRVLILYAVVGPFHAARLRVAAEHAARRGASIHCIEIAGSQNEYRWPGATGCGGAELYRLFPEADYTMLPSDEIARALPPQLNRMNPDVVVLNGWGQIHSWIALSWAQSRRVPRVIVSDSQESDWPRRRASEWVKELIVQECDAGLVGGRSHVRYLGKLGMPESRIAIGTNVIENGRFSYGSVAVNKIRDQLSLLTVSRLIAVKNLYRTLAALSAARDVPWTWTIAGHGPEEDSLRDAIRAAGLQRRVHLLGHVSYDQMPLLHRRHHALLLPSYSEPWGLAVNEAMASGLPILLSRSCGCWEELHREGTNGFSFDPLDVSDIESALRKFWSSRDRWTEMGECSRSIVAPYSLDLFASALLESCSIALNNPRSVRTRERPSSVAAE